MPSKKDLERRLETLQQHVGPNFYIPTIRPEYMFGGLRMEIISVQEQLNDLRDYLGVKYKPAERLSAKLEKVTPKKK